MQVTASNGPSISAGVAGLERRAVRRARVDCAPVRTGE